MLAQQKMHRKSKTIHFMANHWPFFSWFSFFLVIIINIMFIIFYGINADGRIIIESKVAEIIIDALSVIQAIVSFIVIITYYAQSNGVF